MNEFNTSIQGAVFTIVSVVYATVKAGSSSNELLVLILLINILFISSSRFYYLFIYLRAIYLCTYLITVGNWIRHREITTCAR